MWYRILLGLLLAFVLGSNTPTTLRQGAAAPTTRPVLQGHAPQVASYRMDARLDPAAKTVSGTEQITYRNPSQGTLTELWLRLYLRAFRDGDTVWMRESGGANRGFSVSANGLGDITVSKLALADGTDLLASATLTDTLLRVPLPQPLAPGQVVELDATWISKLPRVFARTGYGGRDDTFFMVGQWYPKLAVYDRGHWDTEPWHANSEFFNDFGSYDVSLTVPNAYVVAGAGMPGGEHAADGGGKTLRFTSEDVTDFAFAASPDFKIRTAKAGDVDVVLYYLPEHEAGVDEYLTAAVGALQDYGAWYGAYPHPRLTVVDVPDNAGGAGGMEYPTLVTGGTLGVSGGSGFLALVVAHEIGHQWWPMQTATNEGREPWLDEGITEYSGMRYMIESGTKLGIGGLGLSAAVLDQSECVGATDMPATLPAWQYTSSAYITVYCKTALGLWTLENVVGTGPFRKAMAEYLAEYRFKHPTGADFRAALERSLGGDLGWFFDDYLNGTSALDYAAGPIENAPNASIVHIIRTGGVRAPVEVRVTLASGAQQVKLWDGRAQDTSFSFPSDDRVVSVEVDPAHKLKAELNRQDNTGSTAPQIGPAITLGGRLAFWLQVMAQTIGLFG